MSLDLSLILAADEPQWINYLYGYRFLCEALFPSLADAIKKNQKGDNTALGKLLFQYVANFFDQDLSAKSKDILQLACMVPTSEGNKLKLQMVSKCRGNKKIEKFPLRPVRVALAIVPKTGIPNDLSGIKPQQLAHAINLMDCELMKQIHPNEFKNQNWQRKNKEEVAPNLNYLATIFNHISSLVSTDCVAHADKARTAAKNCTFWIKVMKKLYLQLNYNSCMAVLSGLNSASVQRLKSVWKYVGSKDKEFLNQMDELLSHIENYGAYRAEIAELTEKKKSYIPFLSVVLRDLTFASDGNPNEIEGKLNLDKMQILGKSLHDFYSGLVSYNITGNEEDNDILLKLGNRIVIDPDSLMDLSFKIQPPKGHLWLTTTADSLSEDTLSESEDSSSEIAFDSDDPNVVEKSLSQKEDEAAEKSAVLRVSPEELEKLKQEDPQNWTVPNVGTWLTMIGLSDIVPLFSDASIRGSQLFRLSDKDLYEMGITKLGIRKKLLKRVLELKNEYQLFKACSLDKSAADISETIDPTWGYPEVCRWVSKHPVLGSYAPLFGIHQIDGSTLLQLTKGDLRQMGIKVMGHQLKMIKAIKTNSSSASSLELPKTSRSSSQDVASVFNRKPSFDKRRSNSFSVKRTRSGSSSSSSSSLDPNATYITCKCYRARRVKIVKVNSEVSLEELIGLLSDRFRQPVVSLQSSENDIIGDTAALKAYFSSQGESDIVSFNVL